MRGTPNKDREKALLKELQDNFGYRFFDMKREKDRFEYVLNLSTGKGRVMRVVRLAVPQASTLGRSLKKVSIKKRKAS